MLARCLLIAGLLLALSAGLPSSAHAAAFTGGSCDLAAAPENFQPGAGPTDYTLFLQPAGEVRAVMLFVDFPDAPASESTSDLFDLLVPNSQAWYSEVSYGRMSLNVTPRHQWYRMPKSSSEYGFADGTSFEEHRAYIADAVAAADPDVDFSQFQILYIVSSKDAALPISPTILARPGDGIPADGGEVRLAVTFGNDVRLAIDRYGSHILVHETGHIFGLPDVWRFSQAGFDATHQDVGPWDPMGWVQPGAHFLAWHKRKLGWLDAGHLKCASDGAVEETLTPIEEPGGLKAIIAPTGARTAYVAEVRQKIGQDARLCDTGVLLYLVDTTLASGAGAIKVKDAKAGSDPNCGPHSFAPFNVGASEVSSFEDRDANLKLEVLCAVGSSFVVRMSPVGSAGGAVEECKDTTPPVVSVDAPAKAKLAAVRSKGLKVPVGCDEACDIELKLSVDSKTSRTLNRNVVIGRGTGSLSAAGETKVRVRLTRKGKKQLEDARKLKATLTASVTDTAGNRATAKEKLLLKA